MATATTATVRTDSSAPAARAGAVRRAKQPWAIGVALPAVAALLLPAGPVLAQRLYVDTGIDIRGTASSNPDLAPKGQEKADAWLDISPYVNFRGTLGERFKVSGGLGLGASASLSVREGASTSVSLRPSGDLNGTLEVSQTQVVELVR